MNILSSFIPWFRNGTWGFRPVERQVLDGVVAQLDAERAGRLKARLERINLVQRLDGGREVNAYEMKNGRPVMDASLRLSEAPGQSVLAEFSASTTSGGPVAGKLWLVEGRFFSIEFDGRSEPEKGGELNALELRICC